ncbi:hypothetical protein ACKFKG_22985 [Phormidesmis sp. 146-35]
MNLRSPLSTGKNHAQLAGEVPNVGNSASIALCVTQIKMTAENLCEEWSDRSTPIFCN